MNNGLIYYSLLFLTLSFLGWCLEVAYAAYAEGKFTNRGFLYGPWCPIYGFGGLFIIRILLHLKNRPVAVFLGSVAIATVVELIGGFLLEKIFSLRWWDYTDEKYNLNGYICPKFSVVWGIGAMMVVYGIYPLIDTALNLLPHKIALPLRWVLGGLFVTDEIVSISNTANFSRRLKILENNAMRLRKISDELGVVISERTLKAMARIESIRVIRQKSIIPERISRIYYTSADLKNDLASFAGEVKHFENKFKHFINSTIKRR